MLAPLLGATILLLLVALVASWHRSRALARATRELREGHARRLLQERITQAKAEVEHARATFLADVSRVIVDSLDAPGAITTVVRLAVPFLADACVIDLVDDEGGLRRAAAMHDDPAVVAWLGRRYPPSRPIHPLLARVLAEGRSWMVSHGHKADRCEPDDEAWRPVAALLVPLLARGRTLGVVSFFSLESGRRFEPDDRALAEDLVRRIALAVDNGRLFRAADDAHRRFHDLVEGLRAVVWEADVVRRHYTFVSGRAVGLLGHPLARWLGEPDFWLTVQHPADRDRCAEESRAARAQGDDHDLEYRVIAADGGVVWVLDLVRVVRHPDGSARHLRGVMVDVTASKRAEQALREGEEVRRHAADLALVAALANGASHEINNPLAIIMGNLEVLARRADTPAPLAVRIDAMLAAGRRIAGIVGSMRRITRIETAASGPELPAMLDIRRSSGDA